MHDLIRSRISKEGERIFPVGRGGEVRKQPEQILSIEFRARKGAGDVDAALDVGREDGGVY